MGWSFTPSNLGTPPTFPLPHYIENLMSDNVFHDHLDTCATCRENPMGLCAEGLRTLQAQVTVPPIIDKVGCNPMRSFEDSFANVFG